MFVENLSVNRMTLGPTPEDIFASHSVRLLLLARGVLSEGGIERKTVCIAKCRSGAGILISIDFMNDPRFLLLVLAPDMLVR